MVNAFKLFFDKKPLIFVQKFRKTVSCQAAELNNSLKFFIRKI